MGPAVLAFVVLAIFAFVPAAIADNKGKSFGGYWLFGLVLFVPALIVALLLPEPAASNAEVVRRRPCPQCAELIAIGAKLCRFCGSTVVAPGPRVKQAGKLSTLISGVGRTCTNDLCDAAGLNTDRPMCEVCGSSTSARAPKASA